MVLISTAILGSSSKIVIPTKYKTMFNSIIVPPIRASITGANTRITVEATIAKKSSTSTRYTTVYVSNGNGLSVLLHREDFTGSVERKEFSFDYTEFYGTDVFFVFEIIESNIITKNVTVIPSFISYEKHEVTESCEISTSSPAKTLVLSTTKDIYEKIRFSGFDGLYGRTFGCFDLSTYKIESLLGNDYRNLSGVNCGVFFSDKNGYFSDVGTSTFNITTIPLNLVEEDVGIYHLELANTIYVNPDNLLMSNVYQTGWIPTKRYLYLPKNCKDAIKESSMKFFFDGVGINSSYFSHTFSLNGINNDFGYCQNSKYCVQSEEFNFSHLRGMNF